MVTLADFAAHVQTHLELSVSALLLAVLAAVPLGLLAARSRLARAPVLTAANVGRVLPSLAVLTFVLPVLGVGFAPALVALTLLAIPPIAINTDVGLREVPEAVRDAARGLGMSRAQMLRRVEWPLALPTIFAGVRTAGVEVIASATLATFIGGGGLGDFIVQGLQGGQSSYLLAGTLGVAALALTAQALLTILGRRLGETR